MSIDLMPGTDTTAAASVPAKRRRRMPAHFFVGTLLLYAVVLGTFLLAGSSLQHARPNWHTMVPMSAGVSFYVASNLFLLILGRGQVSRWMVLKVTSITLILTVLLCLILRAQFLSESIGPGAESLRSAMAALAVFVRTLLGRKGLIGESLQFTAMIALEETVKLGVVFVLIWRGRIRTAHAAMLCGALSGLTFGTVEAISFGYLQYPIYPPGGAPVTTYLTRFFVMSPLHGIWDAVACGLVFFFSGLRNADEGKPMPGAYLAAFSCAVFFHVEHNALQAIVGPVMQIVTVFALLAPLYGMAKIARRWAAKDGSPDGSTARWASDRQLVGDLHILTVSFATLFLAASVLFSWAMNADARVQAARREQAARQLGG
jgi:hypothetical protein